jgi:hypothetical protein
VFGQLPEVGAIEINGNRNILLGIGEFVMDLLLQ